MNIIKYALLLHKSGCEANVAQGMLLANGFHFILNLTGSPLFHIALIPVPLRDLKIVREISRVEEIMKYKETKSGLR